MTQHTEGPWKHEGTVVRHYPRGIIANIPTSAEGGVFSWLANARLIAAAPEQNKELHAVKARVERVMLDLDKPVMISSRLESVLVILDAAIALATDD